MNRMLLCAFFGLVTLALSAPAQAPQREPEEKEMATLVTLAATIRSQQAAIAANQVKINEKLAALAEAVRVARIFSSRGGR